MKKFLLFTITAIMLLSALTGCSDKGNVSDNNDGAITDASDAVDDMTDMIVPESTATGRSGGNSDRTQESSENGGNASHGGMTQR